MRNADVRRTEKTSSVKFLAVAAVIFLLLWILVLTAARAVSGTITVSNSFGSSSLSFAASYSSSGDDLDADDGAGSVTVDSDGTITITAVDASTTTTSSSICGSSTDTDYYSTTVTLTITNSYSGTLTVSLSTSDLTLETGDGVTVDSDGYYVMPAESSITLSLASSSHSGSSSSSSSSGSATVAVVSQEAASETYISFLPSDYCVYTVTASGTVTDTSGNEVSGISTDGTTYVADGDTVYTLTITSITSGYEFAGWVDNSGNTVSTDSTYDASGSTTDESYSLTPKFRPSDSAIFYIEGEEGTWYYYLDEAIEAAEASSSKKIVMYGTDSTSSPTTGTVYGSEGQTEFTIPSGITLLLPYDQDDLEIGEDNDDDDAAGFENHDNSVLTSSTSSSNYLQPENSDVLDLTVPEGTTIYVEGELVIGGTLQANANVPSSATYGPHANLYLEGSLVVNSGGVVSVCGYILGDGSVTAQDGSAIYQPFVVMDFLGGTYTSAASAGGAGYSLFNGGVVSGESDYDYVMPFNRFTVQNIQTSITMYSGALMYVYADLYTSTPAQHNTTTGIMVGDSSSTGVITLASGATLYTEYDSSTTAAYSQIGRTSITISGGASLGSLELDLNVAYILDLEVVTSNFIFGIPYNYEINLEGGNYEIAYPMALLPGASLTVAADAELSITGDDTVFLIYDGVDEYTCTKESASFSSSHSASDSNDDYPTASQLQSAGLSRCGELIVNGTLNIESGVTFAGLVQTGGVSVVDGKLVYPTINVEEDVDLDYSAQLGMAGGNSLSDDYAGATVYTLTARVVDADAWSYDEDTDSLTADDDGNPVFKYESEDSTVYLADKDGNLSVSEYVYYVDSDTGEPYVDPETDTVYRGREVLLEEDTTLYGYSGTYYDYCFSFKLYTTDSDSTAYTLYDKQEISGCWSDHLPVARLESTDEDGNETVTYYSFLPGAVEDAVKEGDVVILMADISEDETIEIDPEQDLTICLFDIQEAQDGIQEFLTSPYTVETYTVECDTCLFSNTGTVTLALGGSTVEVDCSVYDEDGVLQYYDTAVTEAVYNTGTMTITDCYTESEVSAGSGGTITFNGVNTGSVSAEGTEDVFAAVVRSTGSSASLTVDNVTLTETGAVSSTDTSDSTTTTACTAGIANSYGSTIESITDVDITSGGWALYNLGGTVELIDGGTWSGAYGILNQNGEVTTVDENTEEESTTSYTGTITAIQGLTLTASSSYAVWNGGTITAIGWGNTFTAVSDTVLNRGTIETIGGEKPSTEEESADEGSSSTEGEESGEDTTAESETWTVSVITATGGCAVKNEGGVVTGTDSDGNDTYSGASIGLISNVEIGGTTYAIYQTGMEECSTVKISIGELGEGLIAWTTSTAVSSTGSDDSGSDTDSTDSEDSGSETDSTESEDSGSSTGSTEEVYYAVGYNTAYSSCISITHISGGDYQHGSGVREYAIQDADSQTYGVYDDTTASWDTNYTLSYTTESVTRSSDSVSGSYYYVIPNTITLVFDLGSYTGNFGVSSLDSITVSLKEDTGTYTGTKITLSDYEDQSDADWEFYGWSVVENDSAADLAPGDYEPKDLIAALEDALSSDTETVTLQAGDSVTLYAVWLPSDLVSVTVEWGELYYEYTQTSAAVYTWDGRNMQYTLESGNGTWTATSQSTDSELDPGTIRITSGETSTMDVAAVVDFEDESGFGLTMSYTVTASTIQDTTFSTDSYTDPFSISTLKSGESVTLSAALSGTPTGSGTNVTLGKVTVTLTEADAEDTGDSSDSEAEESGTE